MLASKYVSNKYIISKLCREVYAFKIETVEKLWAEILLKVQRSTEKLSQVFDLGPRLVSMFLLKQICNLRSHIYK